MNNLSQHIISAKRMLGEIELLTACPTFTNYKLLEEKLIELDKTTSQIWVEFDRGRNETA